jgi:hypothetical protein
LKRSLCRSEAKRNYSLEGMSLQYSLVFKLRFFNCMLAAARIAFLRIKREVIKLLLLLLLLLLRIRGSFLRIKRVI